MQQTTLTKSHQELKNVLNIKYTKNYDFFLYPLKYRMSWVLVEDILYYKSVEML